jgi:hypothetical protein
MTPIARNLAWGLAWALAGATVLSAYVLILTLIRGSTRFESYGTTTWGVLASYYGAALVAGPAVGFLRPLVRSAVGAVIVGILVGTVVYGAVGYAYDGRLDLERSMELGSIVGGFSGFVLWRQR